VVAGKKRGMTMLKKLVSQREEIESFLDALSSIGIILLD
jgi:hypothetical protein